MPFIIDPSKDNSNGVGEVFKLINITLSISLPIAVILSTILWGYKHGFSHFI
tara:strand:+ start:95 stop:250 length:156 start_codon:yes stop_codon:yes gene_type:complete